MQPVALQIQAPKIDPLALAKQGVELGLLMGFTPQQKAEELERQRIANEQSRLNLGISQREDAARRRIGELKARHTTTDPKTGRQTVDHKAVYAAGAAEGIDPKFLEGHRTNMITNVTAELKTDVERENWLKGELANFSNTIRNLEPAEMEGQMKVFIDRAEQAGIPRDRATKLITDTFGPNTQLWQPIARKLGQTATITEQERFEQNARFVGPEAEDPNSALSQRVRNAVRTAGFDVPDSMSAFQINSVPQFKEVLQQEVLPGESKLDAKQQITEIDTARSTLQQVMSTPAGRQLETVVGSVIQSFFDKSIKLDPDRAALKRELDLAMKALGVPLEDLRTAGADTVRRMLRDYDQQLATRRKALEPKLRSRTIPQAVSTTPTTTPGGMIRVRYMGVERDIPAESWEEAKRRHPEVQRVGGDR